MQVTLTVQEMRVASMVGAERCLRAIQAKRQHRHGWDGSGVFAVNVAAAAAEMVVAKVLNRYWTDTQDPDYDGDVGGRTQVRHTPRANGSLLLHRTDPDDHAFILVTGEPLTNTGGLPALTIAGYIMGRDGKRDEFWREGTGRPCFFVPQSALRPLPDQRGKQ